MLTTRIETTVQTDGELHLTELPFRKGDRVQAIVLVVGNSGNAEQEEKNRNEARQHFLNQARASKFRSLGSYPSRDELHERH